MRGGRGINPKLNNILKLEINAVNRQNGDCSVTAFCGAPRISFHLLHDISALGRSLGAEVSGEVNKRQQNSASQQKLNRAFLMNQHSKNGQKPLF